MSTANIPISLDKIQQFVVQFACRTPIRTGFSSAERKALENLLRDSNPELFQLFSDENRNAPYFFQASRQHIIESVTITVPSLVLTNDSVTLLSPVRLGGKFLPGRGESLDTTDLNKRMSDILFVIHNSIRGLRYNRTGKIFELLLGQFQQEDKVRLFQKLVSSDLSLAEVGELDLAFAQYVEMEGETYNIRTVIKYQQLDLGDTFQLGVRVDINNRKLRDRLDPPEIEKVWTLADKKIWEHLSAIIVE